MKSIRVWKLHGISRPFRKFLSHVSEMNGEYILQDVTGHVTFRPNHKKEWTCWVTWKKVPQYHIQGDQCSPSFPLRLYKEMSLWTKLKFWFYQTFYGHELTEYEINTMRPCRIEYYPTIEVVALESLKPGQFCYPVYSKDGKVLGVKGYGKNEDSSIG